MAGHKKAGQHISTVKIFRPLLERNLFGGRVFWNFSWRLFKDEYLGNEWAKGADG